ncbi:MAG: hypothetical protein ETSY1_41135 [Candidatus Entotheonella factor]|uniref:Orc1-like AAA ATPase domain-containing protein n=1 Tax=Entotheonella factor TaxID=1429438 RepID=W4L5P2_ENTF1|nr:MAG: hypothetical protein ETSY1_41135 [Candidatus Entotheonella factor]
MGESQFIGRQSDLEVIEQHIVHCLTGQPRIVLLEGLAGVGKTRFLEEVQIIAAEQGMEIAFGSSDEIASDPYRAFIELLPRLEARDVLETHEITRLQLLFGIAVATASTLTLDAQTQDQVQTLLSLSGGVLRMSEEQPLLVTAENLHAMDPASLEVFSHLAFTLVEHRTAPVLLIGSYRPVTPESATGRLLRRLQSEDITHTLALSGLDEPETRELLQQHGVIRPTGQLVETIHNATRGIPLFIQEAVHHAERTGALTTQSGYLTIRPEAIPELQFPPELSDAITTRINGLPNAGLEVLSIAALIGEEIPENRRMLLGQEITTEVALEVAFQHHLLREVGEALQFTHNLIRQALVSRLTLLQRQRNHINIALALERLYADNQTVHAREIATHLIESGELADTSLLFSYAREAGHQAYSRFAWREAARFFEAAIRASDFSSVRAPLHQQAGLAHYYHQDAGPSLEQFEQAMTYYRTVGDTPGTAVSLIWLVRIRITHASVPIGVLAPYAEELEAALEQLDTSQNQLRGHIMTVLSQAYRHARQPQRAMEFADAALTLGQLINDDRLCAQAGESLGLSYMSALQVEHAIAAWQNALRAAQSADDLMLQILALSSLPLAFNLQGSLEEGEAAALEGVAITKTLQDWSQYSKALSHLTSIAAAKGNFLEVEQHARDTMAMVQRSGYPWGGFRALGALAGCCAVRGLWEEAQEALNVMSTPGRCFATPGRIVEVFARVFRQVALGYEGKYLTEQLIPLCDELMEVATTDTYSLAPLCAMIELAELTFMPEVVERPATILKEA